MVIIKSFLPFRVGLSKSKIYLKLSVGSFVVMINGLEYHYVPTEALAIHVNRETGEVENKNAIFVFQCGKEMERVSMCELLFLSDFLTHLQPFIRPFFSKRHTLNWDYNEIDIIMDQLELENIRRSIDKALDERNEALFYTLLKKL